MTPINRTEIVPLLQAKNLGDGTTELASTGTAQSSAKVADADETRKLQQAAKDFETVFLRQMLSALERTTKVGDKGPNIAGQQAYGSMIVDAVADAVAQAGGIGLGSVLAGALAQKAASTGSEPARQVGASSMPQQVTGEGSRSESAPEGGRSDLSSKLPQGFSSGAVPRAEIRTSAPQLMGQLADRRIR